MDTHENELPDDIRVPLHSLQADVGYLIGRVQADGSCGAAIAASITERLADIEKGIDRLRSQVSPVVEGWQDISTAPKDGTPFIVKQLPYVGGTLCMRRVRWVCGSDGTATITDMGAWLLVYGIDDDWADCDLPTSGDPRWGVAPDTLNDSSDWKWMPLPDREAASPPPVTHGVQSAEVTQDAQPGDERQPGNSRLVYDKAQRTIVKSNTGAPFIAQPQAVGAPTSGGLTIADYEEVFADHKRLVREMDVLLNGDGAAAQASLCDLVAQLRTSRLVSRKLLDAAVAAERETCAEIIDGVAAAARESGASALENVLVGLAETVRSRSGHGGQDAT